VPNVTKEGSRVPEGYETLNGSERRPPPGTKLIGPADPSESFSVTITPRLHSPMRARDGAAPMVRPFSICLVLFFEKDRCALRQQRARRFLVNGPVPHERSTK
jgi:hypothetical protein